MFTRYVSPAVLDQVMDRGDLDMSVSSREYLSILFSDIRSFTSISEQLQPEQVVDLLNTYFSVMSEIAFKYSGTLDKFIGDAIMAFWGAPIRTDDHANKSVLTALEMIKALDHVNQIMQEKGYPQIEIGLGINTDHVILGNIGSERKLDYTVIGDGVNLASRLEGLTKLYKCQIIISEHTYRSLTLDIPCALVDAVRVKGKKEPIRIYAPLALPDDDEIVIDVSKQTVLIAEKAFECYIDKRWDEAITLYQSLPMDGLKEVFIQRCQEFQQNPAPDNWDGVYTLLTK
jgi:adenylate cyclase